jgi:thiamine pyrophosphokinase
MPAEGDVDDRRCLILAGGDPAPLPDRALGTFDLVVAADSGVDLAERLGVTVDVVVGDLDSADPAAVERARSAGAAVERHPVDKDATDLELALEAARTRGVGEVVIVGGTSLERVDHLLAAAGLIAAPRFARLVIEWWIGPSRVIVARGDVTVEGAAGDLVSVIPVGGDIEVGTWGLRWPLDRERLPQGSTRGVSNEMIEPIAGVGVSAGTALVVHTRRAR